MTDTGIPQMIFPQWSAPANIGAASTTRLGGVSQGAWYSLNLAMHVGDRLENVTVNRQIVMNMLQLPSEPAWLRQVHGCEVAEINNSYQYECDASITRKPGIVCVVMTADCLPLLMTDRQGTVVAAVHAGWRGLTAGVIENTLDYMGCPTSDILVWLGPAIGSAHFEVGENVYQCAIDHDPAARAAFTEHGEKHWLCDLYHLARQRLAACGVGAVSGGGFCTYADAERFYSYRRDGITGRMASIIWIK